MVSGFCCILLVFDNVGRVVTAAYGVSPAGVDTSQGAKLWALQMVVKIFIDNAEI